MEIHIIMNEFLGIFIYDLEVTFLFPWTVVLGEIGGVGFTSMMVFLAVLTVGFVYEWRKGALDWS
jgi:NADH:ubiquinone oxidoreductase subunit 3 (subunit A)